VMEKDVAKILINFQGAINQFTDRVDSIESENAEMQRLHANQLQAMRYHIKKLEKSFEELLNWEKANE